MKRATAILLPVLATGVAACGSGNKSQADVPAMTNAQSKPQPTAPAAPKPVAKANAAPKTAGHRADKASRSRSRAHSKAKSKAKPLPTTIAPLPERANYTFAVNGKEILPPGGFVPAGAPFNLVLNSVDGKAHTVKLQSPTQRTIQVEAKHPGKISFGGLAPGKYVLQLDGTKAVATLVAINVPIKKPKS